jgi:PadR family transcriptional regulator, regulatory protein PadR
MREFKKGSLAMLILHLLYERPSYGYELCERLRTRSAGTLSFEDGAVYPLLHALEHDGLAQGYWESEESAADGAAGADSADGDSGRKGPRRRYYRLTPDGVQALRTAIEEWSAFSTAVERVIGEQPAVDGEGRQ